MGKVVQFDLSINKTNSKIRFIFEKIVNDIKKCRTTVNDEELLGELDYLEGYISNLLVKTNNSNWKIESIEERFIKAYNHFNKIRTGEKIDKTFFFSLFIYFTDINHLLLDDNYGYMENMITALDSNMDRFDIKDKKTINKLITDIKKTIVKNVVLNTKDQEYALYDIVDGLLDGRDVFTVSTWYNTNSPIEVDTEEEINLTLLDIVKDYYTRQEDLRFIQQCSRDRNYKNDIELHNKYKTILNNISSIKNFDEEYKSIYLDIVQDINSKRDIDQEIQDVIKLTSLYIEMGKQLYEFDREDIEHFIGLGGKNENRRF